MSGYPGLRQFLGAYLHQDWMDDYRDVWEAVDDFVHSEPRFAPLISAEIQALLASEKTEHQLRTLIVDELDGQYWLEDDASETYRSWLTAVAERVDKVRKQEQQ